MPGERGPRTHKNDMRQPNRWQVDGSLIISGSLDVNGRPDGATIVLQAPVGSDRDLSVQLLDAEGVNCVGIKSCRLHVFADAAGADWATTGGTTGIVDQGAGAIQAVVAKKVFEARSDANGLIELRWTDTGSEVAFLGVELPSGRMVFSAALTI